MLSRLSGSFRKWQLRGIEDEPEEVLESETVLTTSTETSGSGGGFGGGLFARLRERKKQQESEPVLAEPEPTPLPVAEDVTSEPKLDEDIAENPEGHHDNHDHIDDDMTDHGDHKHEDDGTKDDTTGHHDNHDHIDDDMTDHGDHKHEDDGTKDDTTGHHSDHGDVIGCECDAQVAPPGVDATDAEIAAYVAAVMASGEMDHSHHGAMATEHMAAMDLVARAEATHVAVRNGDWSDPNTWFEGRIPGDDAKVLIPEGLSVSYGTLSDARLFTVRVDGTLDFETTTDSRMIFDTMIVSPTGALIIGTVDNPVAPTVNIDLIVANNGPIDTDWDPMLLSRGIISHGATSIHGTKKDSHEKVIENPMAGDTSIKFADVPEGWQVGDTIVIAGTRYDGYKWDNDIRAVRHYEPEDEVRVITEIRADGTVVFDAPLLYNHDTPREDLKTSVANYTRNVTVETENAATAEVWERGHVMFMHSDQVDVRYAAFHELGRTDKSQPSIDISDVDMASFDTNVQGRYALHLHRTGVEDIDNPTLLIGNAVFGSPGWGFVHHDSHAILANNASYNTFGAGYVAETGNETGAWHDNIAIYAQGVSWGDPKGTTNLSTFDIARGGDGFWFQGRLVASTDNVAASVNVGFTYFHRDGDGRMISFDAALFEFPEALYFKDNINPDTPSIRVFSGNETFAAKEGLHVVKASPNQGNDVWSHLTDFTAWSVQSGAHLEYTSHYILENFDIIGKEATSFSKARNGIEFGPNVTEVVIINPTIESFETGIDLRKHLVGFSTDSHDYVVINPTFINVAADYANYNPDLDTILGWDDITTATPSLSIDGPLVFSWGDNWESSGADITGSKTDTLGTADFPGGTDRFWIKRGDMVDLVETTGYWRTSEGEAYTLVNIHFTDRVTGDVYYETHPVFVDSGVNSILGNEYHAFRNAVDNGTQDIIDGMAGTTQLYVPTLATPNKAASFGQDHEIWEALNNGWGLFSTAEAGHHDAYELTILDHGHENETEETMLFQTWSTSDEDDTTFEELAANMETTLQEDVDMSSGDMGLLDDMHYA